MTPRQKEVHEGIVRDADKRAVRTPVWLHNRELCERAEAIIAHEGRSDFHRVELCVPRHPGVVRAARACRRTEERDHLATYRKSLEEFAALRRSETAKW